LPPFEDRGSGSHCAILSHRQPATLKVATHPTEEFYQVTACSLEMKKLNRELRHWEKIYNTIRHRQALGY
jgi:hypothetical protein